MQKYHLNQKFGFGKWVYPEVLWFLLLQMSGGEKSEHLGSVLVSHKAGSAWSKKILWKVELRAPSPALINPGCEGLHGVAAIIIRLTHAWVAEQTECTAQLWQNKCFITLSCPCAACYGISIDSIYIHFPLALDMGMLHSLLSWVHSPLWGSLEGSLKDPVSPLCICRGGGLYPGI